MNTIQRETQIARENQLLTTQLDRLTALCIEKINPNGEK